MPHEYAIIVAKTVTLLLGGLITYFAFKAYRRTGAKALQFLAIGFGIVTIGAILAGTLDLVVGLPLEESVLVNSIVTAIGFATITYALYAE